MGIVAVFIAACGGNEEKAANKASVTATDVTPTTEMAKSEGLIGQSDCVGCHAKDTKVIGPSYVDIAAKYEATAENIETLSGRILLGSKGIWGTVPMTGHPSLSQEDAQEMVKYILSLKK